MAKKKRTKLDLIQSRFRVPEDNILDLRKKEEEALLERKSGLFFRMFKREKFPTVRDTDAEDLVIPADEQKAVEPERAPGEPPAREKQEYENPSEQYFVTEYDESAEAHEEVHQSVVEIEEVDDQQSQFTPKRAVVRHAVVKSAEKKPARALRKKVHLPRLRLPVLHLSQSTRPLVGFVAVCLLLVAPLYAFGYYNKTLGVRGRVLGTSEIAVSHLRGAAESASGEDFTSATDELNAALELFSKAQSDLSEVSGLLKAVPVKGGELVAAEALLEAGEEVALAGQYLGKALAPVADQAKQSDSLNIGTTLLLMNTNLGPALSALTRANNAIQRVDERAVPEEYREHVATVQSDLPYLISEAESLHDLVDLVATIVGHEGGQRVMFLFQNNEEIRPTGGFLGSIGILNIENGEVLDIDVPSGGTYDIDGQLKEIVMPPTPLLLVSSEWGLRDSNWFPDFPESAKKAIWFYEHSLSGGETIDGVIAFTPEVIQRFLEVTGSVEVPEAGVTVSASTVIDEIERQKEASLEETYENPKDFIRLLTPVLLERVFDASSEDAANVLVAFDEALRERHMLFYFVEDSIQERVIARGWGGEVLSAPHDYLMVNYANISGGKTDGDIDDSMVLDVEVQPDGSVVNTLRVTRMHRGSVDGEEGAVRNLSYVRVYVPDGAEFLDSSGFTTPDPRLFQYPTAGAQLDEDLERVQGRVIVDESSGMRINSEFGKTVFGNWFAVEPGASSSFTVQYRLPFTIELEGLFTKSGAYSLLTQKQSGSSGSALHVLFHLPENARVIWRYPENGALSRENDIIRYDVVLDVNRYFGLVLQE